MKVRDLMTGETRACAAWADVGFAAHLMWNGDCGSLPVIAIFFISYALIRFK